MSDFYDAYDRTTANILFSLDCAIAAKLDGLVEESYRQEILSWGWDDIVSSAKDNAEEEYGDYVGREYLGTVFSLMPSGKYYTAYANSNVDDEEESMDELFMAALESVASEHGGWIESGEGDPCDLFFGINVDNEEKDPLPEQEYLSVADIPDEYMLVTNDIEVKSILRDLGYRTDQYSCLFVLVGEGDYESVYGLSWGSIPELDRPVDKLL